MGNPPRWVRYFFFLSLLNIFGISSFNYLVDPHGFNKFISLAGFNTIKLSNTDQTIRFKLPKLISHNWDNIMLGTSRIGVMDNNIVSKYLGGSTFNLSVPSASIEVHHDVFLYASKHNKIKNLIYGIDFFAFNKNKMEMADYLEFKNKIKNYKKISLTSFYFNTYTFWKSIKLAARNILGIMPKGVYFHENGMLTLDVAGRKYDQDLSTKTKTVFKRNYFYKNYVFSSDEITSLKKIITHCKKQNIQIYAYIPPLYVDHFNAFSTSQLWDKFELFERNVAKITSFIDFNGHNTITIDQNNFQSSHHLKREKTELVMARLFSGGEGFYPKGFGVLVSEGNIKNHLEDLKKQIQPFDLGSPG